MKKILFFLYKLKTLLLAHCYCIYPSRGTYQKLYEYKNVFGNASYTKIRRKIFSRAQKEIRQKKRKTLRIVMVDCSEWCTTDIYNYFCSRNFDITVVIAPFFHGTDDSIKKAYSLCVNFCQSKNLQYIDAYNPDDWTLKTENSADLYGDVMLYTNPWMGSYPKELKTGSLPLSILTCYIPYGFMLMKADQHQFNQPSHNMFTCIFCESEIHRQMFKEHCDIGNSHVAFSGHPKMDCYIQNSNVDSMTIWKGLESHPDMIKIIYSPHWNFDGGYATFMESGMQVLKYAESHPDTTSWIYKPHPLLEKELITKGFMTAIEYQKYVDRWQSLPNARMYMLGDYTDIFFSSDCIINDSISFIAEYMYTHKPMLLLTSGQAQFNSFGQTCIQHVYTCKASEFDHINQFIEDVAHNIDIKKAEREKFFEDNLNYYHINKTLAGSYISTRIANMINI